MLRCIVVVDALCSNASETLQYITYDKDMEQSLWVCLDLCCCAWEDLGCAPIILVPALVDMLIMITFTCSTHG